MDVIMKKLIENVKKHRCIWDKNALQYKSLQSKKDAWRAIAEECEYKNVEEARINWKALRDGYRKVLSRHRGIDKTKKKWKYEDLMSFLLPFTINRPKKTANLNVIDSDDDIEESDISMDENSLLEVRQMERSGARSNLKEKTWSRSNLNSQNKALETFFISMFETTNSLPDILQFRIQRQVFNIVMEAQEQHLAATQSHTTPGPSVRLLQVESVGCSDSSTAVPKFESIECTDTLLTSQGYSDSEL